MNSVADVIRSWLQANEIRAIRAYPGEKLPAISSPMAAVELYELNPKEETATVLVSVVSPANLGAAKAEDTALEILLLLKSFGCECKQERVKYLSAPEWFCVEIYATAFGTQGQSWESAPTYAISGFYVEINGKMVDCAKSFEAHREAEDSEFGFADAPWRFRLEEFFAPGNAEPEVPISGFTVVVRRQGRKETYTDCALSGQSRILTAEGQVQILEGIASQLTVE